MAANKNIRGHYKLTELERLTELKSEMFYFREMFHFREPKIVEFFLLQVAYFQKPTESRYLK